MDLEQLRLQLATTGRAEIARHRGRCLAWTAPSLVYLVVAIGLIYGGSLGGAGAGYVFGGVVISAVGLVGTALYGPGVLGWPRVVVDGDGIRVGQRLAPWSEIDTITARVIRARGVRMHVVLLADAEGRTPFHAFGVRGSSWPWGGQVLPRGLVIRQLELLALLTEQLEVTRSGTRPAIAPPLFD